MMKYIAILRGINVGGKRKILMADLKKLCAELEFLNTQTYIQSGNMVFEYPEGTDCLQLADILEKGIHERFGHDVPVIVMTEEDIQKAVSNNPFLPDKAIEKLSVCFLKHEPKAENIEKALSYDYPPDEFRIIGKHVFIHIPGVAHLSKVSNNFFESKLKVEATTRNWKTTLKLASMIKD